MLALIAPVRATLTLCAHTAATKPSQILNVYLRAIDLELKAKEQQELVDRLEELEAALEEQQGRRRYG